MADLDDLADLNEQSAAARVSQLLEQFELSREAEEAAQRRKAGIRKMIEGYVEMFPALEDLLTGHQFDDETEADSYPRGKEAMARVLDGEPGQWMSVAAVLQRLEKRGWAPISSNPANAVRAALERLIATGPPYEKGVAQGSGAVIYRIEPPARGYDDFGEEPF